ncbi:PPE family protein [Mycobacterium sp.]|jgi:PPE-repeat protein|uniref:PPE family protein n=1 Tax=Mycobacterium sp. TaxID=1785 RepID=UPI002BB9BC42|nr:PPE family protein [Mycobacterium sp.]HXB88264.1 PPE family protein [Mycobacterium sp.]
MSFMLFPPEVNSALMYSGAGSGPLMAAASAWNELAADLESTATSYQSVIAQLTGGPWLGPTATRMAAAAAPYIAWLQGSSIQAAQTSGQASLAAAAYESAFDATVPPTVVAANRALLAALVATNFLGQNTPAIAATEALYMEMWFQDGLTMDTYALTSQQAIALPQQTPAPTTSDGGTSANAAAAAQSTATPGSGIGSLGTDIESLLSLDTNLQSFLTNGLTNGLTSVLGDLGVPTSLDSTIVGALTSTGLGSTDSILPVQGVYYATMMASMPAKMLISMANSMNASQAMQASNQAMLADVSALVDAKMKAIMGGISGQLRGFGSAISAQLASAHRLGGLSIPNGWANAAPEMASRAAPVLPQTSVSPGASNLPNSPFTQALMGSLSGRGVGTQAAKTAPVRVETRTPAGG